MFCQKDKFVNSHALEWKIPNEGEHGEIEDVSSKKKLVVYDELETKFEMRKSHPWKRSKTNKDGFFTLQSETTGKYLTINYAGSLVVRGNLIQMLKIC